MTNFQAGRTPGAKLVLALFVGFILSIPLFSIWLLIYDRQSQSETVRASIAEGWGGQQEFRGPLLAIPYRVTITSSVIENGKAVEKLQYDWRELVLSPETATLETTLQPEMRKRSIYEVVVYQAAMQGSARFAIPANLQRYGIDAGDLALQRAEVRFGLSDVRGVYGERPVVRLGGESLALQPGYGSASSGSGFFAWVDADALRQRPLEFDYSFDVRGNGRLSLAPQAGDTTWQVTSPWPHPSFQGSFLPAERRVSKDGFTANYRVGNLALGQTLVAFAPETAEPAESGAQQLATIDLVQPVDLYDQVSRAAKYGFLFIGFTFVAFLLFDIVGGVRVSTIEYLLVGSGLVLFFVLLLALAEVVGFPIAYILASAAIIGLNTAYAASVLKSWRRAGFIGVLLSALYAVLYVLLSLEAFSLLIGALLLFAALAAVMYLTRGIDWGKRASEETAGA